MLPTHQGAFVRLCLCFTVVAPCLRAILKKPRGSIISRARVCTNMLYYMCAVCGDVLATARAVHAGNSSFVFDAVLPPHTPSDLEMYIYIYIMRSSRLKVRNSYIKVCVRELIKYVLPVWWSSAEAAAAANNYNVRACCARVIVNERVVVISPNCKVQHSGLFKLCIGRTKVHVGCTYMCRHI